MKTPKKNKITIQEIAYHRNGISGAGFHAVRFRDGKSNMLATVFAEGGCAAVLCIDLLAEHGVAFGFNSYRGDVFEGALRDAIDEWNNAPFTQRNAIVGKSFEYQS